MPAKCKQVKDLWLEITTLIYSMPKRYKDMEGKRYGKLVIISKADKTDHKNSTYFNCSCDCGKSIVVLGFYITSGGKIDCGCNFTPDLIGKKFEKLSVIKELPIDRHRTKSIRV